jgi:hypothetical protein
MGYPSRWSSNAYLTRVPDPVPITAWWPGQPAAAGNGTAVYCVGDDVNTTTPPTTHNMNDWKSLIINYLHHKISLSRSRNLLYSLFQGTGMKRKIRMSYQLQLIPLGFLAPWNPGAGGAISSWPRPQQFSIFAGNLARNYWLKSA